jgi:hypothetical protein
MSDASLKSPVARNECVQVLKCGKRRASVRVQIAHDKRLSIPIPLRLPPPGRSNCPPGLPFVVCTPSFLTGYIGSLSPVRVFCTIG